MVDVDVADGVAVVGLGARTGPVDMGATPSFGAVPLRSVASRADSARASPTLALATGWGWWMLPTGDVTEAQPEIQSLVATPDVEMMSAPAEEPQPTGPLVVKPRAPEKASPAISILPIEADMLESTAPSHILDVAELVVSGWVLGLVLLTARLTYGLVRAAGMIRRSAAPARTEVVDLLENCRSRMGFAAIGQSSRTRGCGRSDADWSPPANDHSAERHRPATLVVRTRSSARPRIAPRRAA